LGSRYSRSLLLAFEVDGVDAHVRAVRRLDGLVERLLAAAIDAVRENHQRLAAVFGFISSSDARKMAS
jgi:hypothetical protein